MKTLTYSAKVVDIEKRRFAKTRENANKIIDGIHIKEQEDRCKAAENPLRKQWDNSRAHRGCSCKEESKDRDARKFI